MQLFAKFKKNLRRGFRATLNFENLNPTAQPEAKCLRPPHTHQLVQYSTVQHLYYFYCNKQYGMANGP